jgi:regulatory protein YycI of two-component signal transduction system YycFG
MNEFQSKTPTTYRSIMALVMVFLVVDLVIAALLIFNVKLTDFGTTHTDNNSLTNLSTDNIPVPKVVTDNIIEPTKTN